MNLDVLSNPHSDEIAAFLAVAAQGSFVAAGRLLQRHPTIVSKRLAAMEKRLGVRLVERSTRHVRITEAGLQLEQRLRAAVELMNEAQQQAVQGASEVRGTLRLACRRQWGGYGWGRCCRNFSRPIRRFLWWPITAKASSTSSSRASTRLFASANWTTIA